MLLLPLFINFLRYSIVTLAPPDTVTDILSSAFIVLVACRLAVTVQVGVETTSPPPPSAGGFMVSASLMSVTRSARPAAAAVPAGGGEDILLCLQSQCEP